MVDLRLYALVDPARADGRSVDDIAKRVAAGGATLVQLRDKLGATRRLVTEARAIKAALPTNVPLVINDRVDVALAAHADGVHVGQDDMTVADARRLLGNHALIGLSLKTMQQVEEAPLELLDYVAIGGVFATSSKDNREAPVGTDGLRRMAARVRARRAAMPIVAIAGIDAINAADAIAAGADGVAVISALSMTADPARAARDLRAIVDGALTQRSSVSPAGRGLG
jgi:thiamine-phosphate pyrophosphorylase